MQFELAGIPRISSRTTIRARRAASCAACITRSASPQGKLVRVVSGEIFDVAVDIRRSSPAFGRWEGVRLNAELHNMLWIPVGFAHGFVVLSDSAEVLYKATDFYSPEDERCVLWNDPELGIEWPHRDAPILSAKDASGARLRDAEVFS